MQRLKDGTYPWVKVRDGMRFQAGEGCTLRFLATPGHCRDHYAVYFEEEGTVFSGDHVLGYGTTVVNDMFDYMASLRKLLALEPKHLYPGHGPFIQDGVGLLERYLGEPSLSLSFSLSLSLSL